MSENELEIPGYQKLAIEDNGSGMFLYMGTNFVFMNYEQWAEFLEMVRGNPNKG